MFYLAVFTYTFAANAFFLVSPARSPDGGVPSNLNDQADGAWLAASFVEIRPLARSVGRTCQRTRGHYRARATIEEGPVPLCGRHGPGRLYGLARTGITRVDCVH